MKYNHTDIEKKWLEKWESEQLFQQTDKQQIDDAANKLYLLYAFAYPSGSGLHVGHVEPLTALDILARYYRMAGRQVFFPVGWDAFGLPAENYAIKTGVPPAKTTKDAIDNFRSQIKHLGVSYDWANEIATSHPGYYKWTQWLFLQFYNKGLAYKKPGTVNWCPGCQTVLANEQVIEAHCERCDHEVVQKEMNQWYFKITEYAEELIKGLDEVDWPKATKQQQLNWIGKSRGVTYNQKVKDMDIELESYDSVPQTFMAQTFCVIAPEHAVVTELVEGTKYEGEVLGFVEEFKKRKMKNKFQADKEVEGIFTGRYIDNPFGTGDLPIWVATFVIADYGTGFVNASAHDERDFEFAKKYSIPLRPVMFPSDPGEAEKVRSLEYCYHHEPEGVLERPVEFKGRKWGEVRQDVVKHIKDKGFGRQTDQYKLRDWLISRQRYWGAPIPIVYDPEGNPHAVKEDHLPWMLPTDVDYNPKGTSPLGSSKELHERVEKLYGKGWTPEVDTMDTFVCSSWYYFRYLSSRNENEFSDKAKMQEWLPVDFYMIGPEHIVLHLLYSRFFTKFLRDEGYFSFDEPFRKMRHQGMILGSDHKKMSKSKGNVINPDEIVSQYGADTLRVYEMFMGPIEADKPWDPHAVRGVYRFVRRYYDAISDIDDGVGDDQMRRLVHRTLAKVSEDIPRLKFNTAIAAMMEMLNGLDAGRREGKIIGRSEAEVMVRMLAPFAPFVAEEMYQQTVVSIQESGKFESVHQQQWPEFDKYLVQEGKLVVVVQVNGKRRSELRVETHLAQDKSSEDEVMELVKQDKKVMKWVEGKEVRKVIWVPAREKKQGLVNLVVG